MKNKMLNLLAVGGISLAFTGQAALIVFEGFNYPVGSSLPGQNGGNGWLGAWIGPNLGGTTGGSDLPLTVTNGLSWTNGPGYIVGAGNAIADSDDGGPNHATGHGDARQWFDPSNPFLPFDQVHGTNIWFSFLATYDVVSTSGGLVIPFEDSFQALSGIGVSLKGGAGALQVYIRQHGTEMSTNTVNHLQASGTLTNVALVVGRFRLGPVVANPLFDPGNDRLDVWLNQTREPTNDSALFMAGFSALRTSPYSQGYFVVRTGGGCQMKVDEIKIGKTFAEVVPTSAASPNPKPAAPMLSLTEAGPVGLQFNAGAGTTNQRNQITTVPSIECSWVGAATADFPARYSFTITNPPAKGATNFLAYAWLIPAPDGFISADSSNPNVVRWAVQSDGHGAAIATLAYKVNSSNDTAMFFSSGFLCGLTNTPFGGTWTLSLTNDTDFLMTAPDGSVARGSMPGGDAGYFASPVSFFLGVSPGGAQNLGRCLTVSDVRVEIPNAGTSIHSDFTTGAALDDSIWQILADDPASIIVMPSNSVYRATWRNAVGAGVGPNTLVSTNAVAASGLWPAANPGIVLGNGTNVVFVTADYTTNAAGFFRVRIPYDP